MPVNPAIWSEAFHRASREEIGIAITVSNRNSAMTYLNTYRPVGFADYTVVRPPADATLLFIIKPGVTLDDPVVMHELFHGGKDV